MDIKFYVCFFTALLNEYVSQEGTYTQLIKDVNELTVEADSLIAGLSTDQTLRCGSNTNG